MRRFDAHVVLVPLVMLAASCGGNADSRPPVAPASALAGRIEADGSSRVGLFMTAAAQRFQLEFPSVRTTVRDSDTSRGFERLCDGDTDLSGATRPIKAEEAATCDLKGVEYVEFQVAKQIVRDGTYTPLMRPLYVYANKTSIARRAVSGFIGYTLVNASEIAKAAGHTAPSDEQIDKAMSDLTAALSRVGA